MSAALACFVADVDAAHAQSQSCQRLTATLATLDRNADYRSVAQTSRQARAVGQDVQRAESAYVRNGCNDDAKAGRQLSRECRALAREITTGREQYAALVASVETGNAVAQQREALLQEIARFGCGSRVRVLDDDDVEFAQGGRRNRGNLFDQLFDALSDGFDGGGGFREETWDPWGDYHTVRTLCVRKSDGFYWPISYSTLIDYVPNDAEQCRAMCPTLEVELYYYDNPGQEPEQMVNQWGEPYTSLPNAFKFRTDFDTEAKCQQKVTGGQVTLATLADGSTRAMVSYEGVTFPLPVRDPRNITNFVTPAVVAEANVTYVDIPLPRPRPAAPGETPVVVAVPVAPVASNEPGRVVSFGGKRVRVVGPDTPYARVVAAGT